MKSNVTAINVTGRDERPNKLGEYCYIVNRDDEICAMFLFCPCGCGPAGIIPFDNYKAPDNDPIWTWNGNEEKPTLKPSIFRTSGCKWHGWLTDGIFKEC